MSSIRRNFVHNTKTHGYIAFVFLLADLLGLLGFEEDKQRLIKYGEKYHDEH